MLKITERLNKRYSDLTDKEKKIYHYESYCKWKKANQKNGKYLEYRREIGKRERNEKPLQYWCRSATRNAIKKEIIKIKECIICGTNKKVECHHENYLHPLEVKFLCIKHHKELHKQKLKFQDYVKNKNNQNFK